MKNLLPTLLVVLCSYSSLYFPVISLDARGHLALLRFFQDVLVLHTQPCHNVSQHPQRVPAQRRDPAQHPQTRLSHPPRHLDLWLLPRHIPHQVSLLIHYCGFFSIFSHFPLHPASSSCWCSATRPSARCPPRRRSRESLTSSSPGSSPSSPSPSSSS